MKKIIFDIAVTGHHSEYISHLVDFIVANPLVGKYHFVVSEELELKFPKIVKKSKGCDNISWVFVSKLKIKAIHNLPLLKRSFAELALVEEYAKNIGVKNVYLLYFNIFQIALIFKRTSFNITAILFLQFLRMPKDTWKNKLKYYRKYITTKLYTYNSKIKRVFILNDNKTVNYLNKEFNTDIFKMLPDPIPVYQEEVGFDVHSYYNIDKRKKILLHPGAINPRKGTYEIIEAIDYLKEKETNDYAILIVGKATPNVEKIALEKINKLKNKEFTIVFDNTFVSNERLKALFVQSYAVLMPYKNAEASSGILGHAAAANKIVIGPRKGLLGDLIVEYELGIVLDEIEASKIANGVKMIIKKVDNKEKLKCFLSTKTINLFASKIFN